MKLSSIERDMLRQANERNPSVLELQFAAGRRFIEAVKGATWTQEPSVPKEPKPPIPIAYCWTCRYYEYGSPRAKPIYSQTEVKLHESKFHEIQLDVL